MTVAVSYDLDLLQRPTCSMVTLESLHNALVEESVGVVGGSFAFKVMNTDVEGQTRVWVRIRLEIAFLSACRQHH